MMEPPVLDPKEHLTGLLWNLLPGKLPDKGSFGVGQAGQDLPVPVGNDHTGRVAPEVFQSGDRQIQVDRREQRRGEEHKEPSRQAEPDTSAPSTRPTAAGQS